jgi:hypothetical protein
MPSASKAARNSSRCFHSCCVSRPLARRAASRRNGPIRLMSSESAGVPSAGPESETKRSSYLPSSSAAIGGHRGAIRVYSAASSSWDGEVQSRILRGNQRGPSLVDGGPLTHPDQWQSVAISGNQWPSVAISGNQWQSMAISGNQCPLTHPDRNAMPSR